MATLRLSGPLRESVGRAELRLPGDTVGAVLSALVEVHPAVGARLFDERGALRRHVSVFVNGEDARFSGALAATVGAKDVVTVLQAMAGG
jgi:molybdopterin converting factor small subunit